MRVEMSLLKNFSFDHPLKGWNKNLFLSFFLWVASCFSHNFFGNFETCRVQNMFVMGILLYCPVYSRTLAIQGANVVSSGPPTTRIQNMR